MINGFDFVILNETWSNSPDIDVEGFRFIVQHATQSNSSSRNSGGVILFYKNALYDWISVIKTTQISYHLELTGHTSKLRKIYASVDFIYLRIIQNILNRNYLKNLKKT